MSKPETLGIVQFLERFPDEASATLFFENLRWPQGVTCPRCRSKRVSRCKGGKPMPYRCLNRVCLKHFSVRTNSAVECSPIPLRKLLLAMYLMTSARKGVSSIQLAKELDMTQKTAWFMEHRIREAFASSDGLLGTGGGIVEADEAYLGGKEKNKHFDKKLRAGRGPVGKTPVMGLRDRDTGTVIAVQVDEADAATLGNALAEHVAPDATIHTDESAVYRGLANHETVNHGKGEYVRGDVTTNGVVAGDNFRKNCRRPWGLRPCEARAFATSPARPPGMCLTRLLGGQLARRRRLRKPDRHVGLRSREPAGNQCGLQL